jgi:hypothetical protein
VSLEQQQSVDHDLSIMVDHGRAGGWRLGLAGGSPVGPGVCYIRWLIRVYLVFTGR